MDQPTTFNQHLLLLYGEAGRRLNKEFQKLKLKSARLINTKNFLVKCRESKVTPQGLQVKVFKHVEDLKVLRQVEKMNEMMVKKELQEVRGQIWRNSQQTRESEEQMRITFNGRDYQRCMFLTNNLREVEFQKVKRRHIDKLNRMRWEKREKKRQEERRNERRINATGIIKFEVKNLTDEELDQDVVEYLKLGPNFAVAPRKLPVEDVVIETERVAKRFEKKAFQIIQLCEEQRRNMSRLERMSYNQKKADARELRKKVQEAIKKQKNKPLESNLTRTEVRGKKKVEQDKERVYVQADKGHVMVVMWKTEEKGGENSYDAKINKLLDDQGAVRSTRAGVDYDPTRNLEDKAERIIRGIVARGEMTKDEADELLKLKEGHSPRLSGLPKIHKPVPIPLRPVVSCIETPFSKISKHLTKIFQKYLGRSGVTVKNSLQLKRKLEGWDVENNPFFVSFDVKSLYPKVPIPEAISLLSRLVEEDQELDRKTKLSPQSVKELLTFCLTNSYFEVNQKWFKINCGMIGLDLMGVTADLYMEQHEMNAVRTSEDAPSDQARYVDDYISRMEDENNADRYLNHLNSLEPEIQFTIEKEENNKISVLDLQIEKDLANSRLVFDVHYKPTCTNIQVKKRSNHPEACKKGIIKGFADRNRRLCSQEKLVDAQKFTEKVFVANGFSPREVKDAMKAKEKVGDAQEEMTEGTIRLPYVKGFSESLRKIFNTFGVRAAFRCGSRVKDVGHRTKSALGDRKKNVVYEIPCICGAVYIGQTERAIKTRHKEHEADLRLTRTDLENGQEARAEQRMRTSKLVQHCVTDCGLNPDWEAVKILGTDQGWMSRRLRETFFTKKKEYQGKRIINETDVMIDESWTQTLQNVWSKEFWGREVVVD
jgi:hypothetical protein